MSYDESEYPGPGLDHLVSSSPLPATSFPSSVSCWAWYAGLNNGRGVRYRRIRATAACRGLTCMCVCVCVCSRMCVRARVCASKCVRVYSCVCVRCMHMRAYVCVCVCVCVYVCVCGVCVRVCAYMYMCDATQKRMCMYARRRGRADRTPCTGGAVITHLRMCVYVYDIQVCIMHLPLTPTLTPTLTHTHTHTHTHTPIYIHGHTCA